MIHISLAAEKIVEVFGFPITNTLLTSWLVMAVLILLAYYAGKNPKIIPGKLQNVAEIVIDGLLDFMTTIAGSRKDAERFFPIVATIFFFVLASNWAGILPGVGSIGFFEEPEQSAAIEETVTRAETSLGTQIPETASQNSHDPAAATEEPRAAGENPEEEHGGATFVPLLRTVNSDLNATLALALIAVTLSHYFGIAALGAMRHAGKFFNFKNPIDFFVGILEFISEFAKIISFSFRLFGNIFAGEVLLVIMTSLVPILAPLPFYGLELFVGLIQALIFAVLTMMFFVVATEHH